MDFAIGVTNVFEANDFTLDDVLENVEFIATIKTLEEGYYAP